MDFFSLRATRFRFGDWRYLLSMVRSVSLIVLCIFAKRFVLSVSGFLSQRNFCTTAVLLWGTHWGAVSWIVLLDSLAAERYRELWAMGSRNYYYYYYYYYS